MQRIIDKYTAYSNAIRHTPLSEDLDLEALSKQLGLGHCEPTPSAWDSLQHASTPVHVTGGGLQPHSVAAAQHAFPAIPNAASILWRQAASQWQEASWQWNATARMTPMPPLHMPAAMPQPADHKCRDATPHAATALSSPDAHESAMRCSTITAAMQQPPPSQSHRHGVELGARTSNRTDHRFQPTINEQIHAASAALSPSTSIAQSCSAAAAAAAGNYSAATQLHSTGQHIGANSPRSSSGLPSETNLQQRDEAACSSPAFIATSRSQQQKGGTQGRQSGHGSAASARAGDFRSPATAWQGAFAVPPMSTLATPCLTPSLGEPPQHPVGIQRQRAAADQSDAGSKRADNAESCKLLDACCSPTALRNVPSGNAPADALRGASHTNAVQQLSAPPAQCAAQLAAASCSHADSFEQPASGIGAARAAQDAGNHSVSKAGPWSVQKAADKTEPAHTQPESHGITAQSVGPDALPKVGSHCESSCEGGTSTTVLSEGEPSISRSTGAISSFGKASRHTVKQASSSASMQSHEHTFVTSVLHQHSARRCTAHERRSGSASEVSSIESHHSQHGSALQLSPSSAPLISQPAHSQQSSKPAGDAHTAATPNTRTLDLFWVDHSVMQLPRASAGSVVKPPLMQEEELMQTTSESTSDENSPPGQVSAQRSKTRISQLLHTPEGAASKALAQSAEWHQEQLRDSMIAKALQPLTWSLDVAANAQK